MLAQFLFQNTQNFTCEPFFFFLCPYNKIIHLKSHSCAPVYEYIEKYRGNADQSVADTNRKNHLDEFNRNKNQK